MSTRWCGIVHVPDASSSSLEYIPLQQASVHAEIVDGL